MDKRLILLSLNLILSNSFLGSVFGKRIVSCVWRLSSSRKILGGPLSSLTRVDLVILSSFEKSKTKDYAVKRKNRTLTGLNKRFSELYGTSLFYNQKSKTDSRQTNYLLNEKINLKNN